MGKKSTSAGKSWAVREPQQIPDAECSRCPRAGAGKPRDLGFYSQGTNSAPAKPRRYSPGNPESCAGETRRVGASQTGRGKWRNGSDRRSTNATVEARPVGVGK